MRGFIAIEGMHSLPFMGIGILWDHRDVEVYCREIEKGILRLTWRLVSVSHFYDISLLLRKLHWSDEGTSLITVLFLHLREDAFLKAAV